MWIYIAHNVKLTSSALK